MAAIAAVGMFDGVHLGHRAILDTLKEKALETGRDPIVFTFDTHPRELISGEAVPLITPIEVKRELISQHLGVPVDVQLLDRSVFGMYAGPFLNALRMRFGVDSLVMGFNNRIGHDRLNAADIAYCCNTEVFSVDARYCGKELPSSTLIREAISRGDINAARAMLGHGFTVRGTVVEGNHIGRTIGFPTANIITDTRQILPADRSYIVDVQVDGLQYRGMANIGTRPTLNDGRGKTLEVNIFDFAKDIYGDTIEVDFLAPLRQERTFKNLEDLKAQLDTDRCNARLFHLR